MYVCPPAIASTGTLPCLRSQCSLSLLTLTGYALQAAKAKTVTTYVQDARMHSLQQGDFQFSPEQGPHQRTPLELTGDQAPVMLDGVLVGLSMVLDKSIKNQAGRPMLGAVSWTWQSRRRARGGGFCVCLCLFVSLLVAVGIL